MRRLAPIAVIACLAVPAAAVAAPPAACGGVMQISDARGDGHHARSDVLRGWFSEAAGRLQAVIEVDSALWEPAHEDSSAAGFALLFEAGGTRRYVRVEAPSGGAAARFDHGTWTPAGGFASAGPTTGATTTGRNGSVTIDIPAAPWNAAGAVIARPFALTYEAVGGDPHWVDRAPGGESPTSDEYGADYVIASCQGQGGAGPGSAGSGPAGGGNGGGADGGPGGAGAGGVTTTGLTLSAPSRVRGARTVTVSGRITPARPGVPVELTAGLRGRRVVRRAFTGDDGRWSLRVPVGETTRWRATAEGIGSQTVTTTVRATVSLKIRRLASGGVLVTGRVSPRLGGRVLLLRSDSIHPSARATPRRGLFRIRLRRPRKGRYQALFIPSGARAERAISKAGVIR